MTFFLHIWTDMFSCNAVFAFTLFRDVHWSHLHWEASARTWGTFLLLAKLFLSVLFEVTNLFPTHHPIAHLWTENNRLRLKWTWGWMNISHLSWVNHFSAIKATDFKSTVSQLYSSCFKHLSWRASITFQFLYWCMQPMINSELRYVESDKTLMRGICAFIH